MGALWKSMLQEIFAVLGIVAVGKSFEIIEVTLSHKMAGDQFFKAGRILSMFQVIDFEAVSDLIQLRLLH